VDKKRVIKSEKVTIEGRGSRVTEYELTDEAKKALTLTPEAEAAFKRMRSSIDESLYGQNTCADCESSQEFWINHPYGWGLPHDASWWKRAWASFTGWLRRRFAA